jgi:hypothetical protein
MRVPLLSCLYMANSPSTLGTVLDLTVEEAVGFFFRQ